MTLKEDRNVACTHISLRDRWRHLPDKGHRTIGNVLHLMLIPVCIALSIALPFLSMIVSHYIIGDPHPNEVARDGFTTPFFIGSLIFANVSACAALWLYWSLLIYLAKRFHSQSPRHGLTMRLIQDSANREVYDLAYLNHLERVESLRNAYHSRIQDLYSDNAGAVPVSEVRDELRTVLQDMDTQLDEIRHELLENEDKQGFLEFTPPKLSETWISFVLLCVAVIVILGIQYHLIF